MKFFGKKKEKEKELEEEELREEEKLEERKIHLENRRLKKKLKDLNPDASTKRKEPPKPWGKSERLIVGIFFIVTTFSATLMFMFSHGYKLPGLPRISFNKINLKSPFSEEIIEIGQKSASPKNDNRAQKAISLFKEDIKPVSGYYGFIVTRLKTGESYGVSTNGTFQGASLLKLPLMAFMYDLSKNGELDLNMIYTLKAEDKVKGSGVLINKPPGTTFTYKKLAEYMGHDSDRTAYKVMKDIVGEENFKKFVYEVGMTDTDIETGMTTPTDMSIILQNIWNGDIVNNEGRNELLGFLTDTIYEKWITAGVPSNIKVMHKYGQDAGVVADGGIIETEDPYILVIMGNGITQHDADFVFPKISKDIYSVETGDN